MASTKKLPLGGPGGRGPMIGIVGRVLIYVVLDVLVVTIAVLAKNGPTVTGLATIAWGDPVSGALVGSVAYLFWRPRYVAAP